VSVTTGGQPKANAERLKALAIAHADGIPVLPSMPSVQDGSYQPLSRPLFIYVNDKDMRANDEIRSFVGFTVGNGLKLVEQAGYIGDLPVGLSIGEALRRSFDDTRKPEFR
jgi:phosphate transport system substrate-binding protein